MFADPITLVALLVSVAGVLLVLRGRRIRTTRPPPRTNEQACLITSRDDAGAPSRRVQKQSRRAESAQVRGSHTTSQPDDTRG
jgi:hypothetical protein